MDPPRSVAPPPGPAVPTPAAPGPVALKPAPQADPRRAWVAVIESLTPFSRSTVADQAAFSGYDAGLLTLTVRNEHARSRVREQLRNVDFSAFFIGFRNLDVRLGGAGTTGREHRAVEDERRRTTAQVHAEASSLVKQLQEMFAATLISVEPAAAPARDTFVVDTEEELDEQSV